MKPTTPPAPTAESRFLETWQAFIQAKDEAVRAGEKPLRIKPPTAESITSAELRAELDLVDEPAVFYAALRARLGIGDDAIDSEQGYFYLDGDAAVSAEKLLGLKGIAERCHFDFEPAPVIEGEIGGEAQLLAHITTLLRAADLGLPWKVTMVAGKGKANSLHAQIRVLSPPDRMATSAMELADLRQVRATAGLRLRKALLRNEFIILDVEPIELAPYDLTTYERPASLPAPVLTGWLASHQIYPAGMGRCLQYAFEPGTAVPPVTPEMSDSPLTVVEQALMREFPGPAMEVTRSGWQLKFRLSLDYTARVEQSLHIQNFLNECLEPYQLSKLLRGTDRFRFIARNDEKAREQDGADRLRRLIGEELTIVEGKRRFVVGTLKSVSYPKLRITLPEDFDEDDRPDLLHRLSAGELTPNLTGEREMIARLRKALDTIANPESKLLNPQTRRVLIDAAAAGGMADPRELEPDSATRRAIAAHSFQGLNDSQARAVAAILHTPDLAMVQGPPGTGKSTAISQIIWHLVRVQPRCWLLLTSETHTAVDNALEKLENPHHNLVRPIRVGSEKSLEREGARYALPRLQAWALGSETEPAEESAAVAADLNDNALCYWLRNISRRAQGLTQNLTQNGLVAAVPTGLQAAWAAVLLTPSAPVRQLVLDAYLGHVNVVGATTGSLGDKTTYGTKTRFYQQYETLVAARKRVAEKQPLTAEARAAPPAPRPEQRSEVAFDVVVIDEASKAGPPELALAMIYAHKAVVIGDHRQLPPMLDEDEFRTTLREAGKAELSQQFSRSDAEISQFERMFTRPGMPPGVLSRFDTQYRMHPDINAVIEQFYQEDGGLRCGLNPADADSPELSNPASRHHGLTHPALVAPHEHLVWVEVDEPELQDGTSRINPAEVQAVRAVLACLGQSEGFADFQAHWQKPEDREVALITFYGKQAKLLEPVAREAAPTLGTLPRLQTVDKFQGMERNIVVVSLVRSDKLALTRGQQPDLAAYPASGGYRPQPDLGFAKFPNRLNVALSRAKRLLIIVGNSRHFSRNDCYQRVFDLVRARGRVVNYHDLLPFIR